LIYIANGLDRGCFRHMRPDGATSIIRNPNEYVDVRLDQRAVIAKLHGSVDRVHYADSFVITEDHYIDYIIRPDVSNLFPVTLAAKLRRSHFLFLGYDLRDWALRLTLWPLWRENEGSPCKSWVIMSDPSPIDMAAWEERGVDIIRMPLEDYLSHLEGAVAEIGALRVIQRPESI
jgi:hypothetical protein